MRILAVTNLYPNPKQPHRASFNRRQFAALALDHDVRVIAPIAWTSGLAPQGARVESGIISHHPHYLYTPKVLRAHYGHFYQNSIRPTFHQHVREWHPDVVLACWAYPDGWAAVRLAREYRLPVAIKVHGSDLLTLTPRDPRYARTAEALAAANTVIAVSNNLREKALAMGAHPHRTHVVYNGIDAATFHSGPRDHARQLLNLTDPAPLILFIGNLLPVKGPDILINALARARDAHVPFRCVCIGQGPMTRELRALVDRHALAAHIEFRPPCPQEQLANWYRAADLLVLPSRSEGTPNVLLEAAACATPFIATNVGGVPDLCDPAALVQPNNPAALAQRIQHFLTPATRPTLRPRFTPGSWSDSARSLATVLERITRKQHAAAA